MTGFLMRLVILGCVLLNAGWANAQFPTGAGGGRFNISGRVYNAEGNRPLDTVLMSLRNFSGMTMAQTSTDAMGNFTFSGLGRGVYYVHANKSGFSEASERVEIVSFSVNGLSLFLAAARMPQMLPGAPISVTDMQVPEKALATYKTGMRHRASGELPEALASLRKATEEYPAYILAHYWLAMTLLDLDRIDEARQGLEKVISLDKNMAAAYFPLGAIQASLGEHAKAQQTLLSGLRLSPKAWQGHYELARLLLLQGQIAQAEKSAARALELNSEHTRTYVLLAQIYHVSGRDKLAILAAEKYLEAPDDEALAQQVRATIEQIKAAPVEP